MLILVGSGLVGNSFGLAAGCGQHRGSRFFAWAAEGGPAAFPHWALELWVTVASTARLLAPDLRQYGNVAVKALSGGSKGLCSPPCRHLEYKSPTRYAVSSMT